MDLEGLKLGEINNSRDELTRGTVRVLEGFNAHNMVTDALPLAHAVLCEADHTPFQAEFDVAYLGLSARIAERNGRESGSAFYTPGFRRHDENKYLAILANKFTEAELRSVHEKETE